MGMELLMCLKFGLLVALFQNLMFGGLVIVVKCFPHTF